jgi:Spy/CpxP family protein refolding chaperone
MKLSLLLFALTAALALPASAEEPKPATPRLELGTGQVGVEEWLKQTRESLQLTDEQVGRIRAAYEKREPRLRELREDTALSPEQRRAKANEILLGAYQDALLLLTEVQVEKYVDVFLRNPPLRSK